MDEEDAWGGQQRVAEGRGMAWWTMGKVLGSAPAGVIGLVELVLNCKCPCPWMTTVCDPRGVLRHVFIATLSPLAASTPRMLVSQFFSGRLEPLYKPAGRRERLSTLRASS